MLLEDFVNRQAARVMSGFGMIGDSKVLIPSIARRFCHDLKRIHAVREVRMRMQDAA